MKFNNIDKSFYDKMSKSLSNKEYHKLLVSNKIIKERVDVLRIFIINLSYNVVDTYLGVNYLKTEDDYYGHFTWCINKTINEFKEQDIDFSESFEIFDYFYEYFYVSLYSNQEYEESFIINHWFKLFDFEEKIKYQIDVDTIIDIYDMFNAIIIDKLK